ncbi:MAG: site-2 protease family protein [Chloroflexi bacterium]|nr:site-2 protease family protein [Chloroflexota bacterium]
MGASIHIGKILGIPIGINYSWFIIFVLITLSLAVYQFPAEYPAWSRATYWVVGILTSLLFFGSILAHELSHSVIAIAGGIPVKSITLFVFGGVSQISKEATNPRTELIMAAAGPFSSFVLAGVFYFIWLFATPIFEPVGALGRWLAVINLLLGVFNLIPGFPMDGGRVLRSILWGASGDYRRATEIATYTGRGIAYLFILGGILIMFSGNWFNGLWLAFIGWFLENAASGSYRQMVLKDSLRGFKARDLMTQECSSISPRLSVRDLVYEQILPGGRRCFLVTDDARLSGFITLHNLREVPQDRWSVTSVAEAMTPVGRLKTVAPDDEAFTVLERMDGEDVNQMPVVEDGKVIGMIGRDNVLRFLRTRAELGV